MAEMATKQLNLALAEAEEVAKRWDAYPLPENA